MKPERILNIPHAVNFRELGGYQNRFGQTIKWQKLLRSGELSSLNPQAIQMLEDYGLKYDIDLRSPSEVCSRPDRVPDQTILRSYPVYPIFPGEYSDLPTRRMTQFQSSESMMRDQYTTMILSEHSRLAFRQMFLDLLDNRQDQHSLLFHCAAGKDRTGVAGMLIMAALQVPFETIRQDYLLTNVIYSQSDPEVVRRQLTNEQAPKFIQKMNSVYGVLASNLERVYNMVEARFGDWDHYFKEALELTEQDLADLRQIYLE
jgi:protein-tyrosine phosphatase